MQMTIEGLKINYIVRGEGRTVLLLHGWGACIGSFAPVTEELAHHRKVYALDFPGFGESDMPAEPMTVADYARFTAKFIEEADIRGTDVICHIFGGRVTIVLAATRPELVGRLIFTDAAGLRKKRTVRYYTKVYGYKLMKRCAKSGFMKKAMKLFGVDVEKRVANAGSEDYKKLSGAMRATFVNVVNEDLRRYLRDIKSPSLMIYGEDDADTPVYFGEIMEKEIADSGLCVLKNAGHFSYLDQFPQYMRIVKVFLEVAQ